MRNYCVRDDFSAYNIASVLFPTPFHVKWNKILLNSKSQIYGSISNTCQYVTETRFYVVLASMQRLCRPYCASMGTTLRQYKQSDKCANTTSCLCALSNGHQIVALKEIPTRPWWFPVRHQLVLRDLVAFW